MWITKFSVDWIVRDLKALWEQVVEIVRALSSSSLASWVELAVIGRDPAPWHELFTAVYSYSPALNHQASAHKISTQLDVLEPGKMLITLPANPPHQSSHP